MPAPQSREPASTPVRICGRGVSDSHAGMLARAALDPMQVCARGWWVLEGLGCGGIWWAASLVGSNGGQDVPVAVDRDGLLCLDGAAAADLRSKRIQPYLANRAAPAARLLGDLARLLIAATLDEAGELRVHGLACVVGREDNLVSHHVRATAKPMQRKLTRSAGVVQVSRRAYVGAHMRALPAILSLLVLLVLPAVASAAYPPQAGPAAYHGQLSPRSRRRRAPRPPTRWSRGTRGRTSTCG